jgi:antitoxin component of MazEF toxin-antitoxin module
MGYKVKIQRVDRGKTNSYYINFPAALAESCGIEKAEEIEWEIEDRNTFILKRVIKKESILKKKGGTKKE